MKYKTVPSSVSYLITSAQLSVQMLLQSHLLQNLFLQIPIYDSSKTVSIRTHGREQAREPVVGSHCPLLLQGPNKALPEKKIRTHGQDITHS